MKLYSTEEQSEQVEKFKEEMNKKYEIKFEDTKYGKIIQHHIEIEKEDFEKLLTFPNFLDDFLYNLNHYLGGNKIRLLRENIVKSQIQILKENNNLKEQIEKIKKQSEVLKSQDQKILDDTKFYLKVLKEKKANLSLQALATASGGKRKKIIG